MTLLTILGLLTQALTVWCFRLGAGSNRGSLHEGPALLKRNDSVPWNGEGSASSASAALLQPELQPSFVPTSSVEPRLAVATPASTAPLRERGKREKLSVANYAALREQLEYWLSDEHLHYDKILHDKISEANGWLDIASMVRCRNMTGIRLAPEDVLAALKGSMLEVKQAVDFDRSPGNAALPRFESKPKRKKESTRADGTPLSESLQTGLQPSFELGAPNATVVHRPADSLLASPPVATPKPEAASVAAPLAALRTTRANLSAPDLAALLKLVTYCLSDEYLRHDKVFFDNISSEAAGWSEISLVLTCRNVRRLRATPEGALAALKEAKLEVKEGDFVRRLETAALPTFKSKPEQQEEANSAERSTVSASSESLQPAWQPSLELGIANSTVEHGPAFGEPSPLLSSPVVTTKPDAASVAAPSTFWTTQAKQANLSAPDNAALLKQAEYCLSDEYLRYEKVFLDPISSVPIEWLDIALILTCRNIRNLRATPQDVLAALKESNLGVEEGHSFVRRTEIEALPNLKSKTGRQKETERAERFISSTSSESLQPGLQPSFELGVAEATVEPRPADRVHPYSPTPPITTAKPEAASVAATSADLRPHSAALRPRPMSANLSAPDHAALRKQVEHCLSDKYLRHDKFFHDKISSEPDGWLDIELLLRCQNIKGMTVTTDDILAALTGSRLEVKEGGGFLRRSGNAMLPKFEPKKERRKKEKSSARSTSSAWLESLQRRLQPSFELGIPKATVEPRPADTVRSPLVFSPIAAAKPEAVSVAPPLAALRPRAIRTKMSDHAALRKKVEYCLSDKHLRYDKFLHDKISSEPDGWLDIELTLRCPNMNGMKLTTDDILAALMGSRLEVKEGGGFVRRSGNAALPKLQPERKEETKRAQRSAPSASSESLEVKFRPPFDLEVPNATVESRLADRKAHNNLLSHLSSTELDAKPLSSPSSVPRERAKVSAPDHVALRRQVEYCLSDEHLRYDRFFHDKISSEPDGWLDIALILRCRNLKGMKVTTDDILASLMGSRLEVQEGGGFVRRSGNAALPKLELRRERKTKRAPGSALSASSGSLPVGFRPPHGVEVPTATVEARLARRILHNNLLSPLLTTERDAELVTTSLSISRERAKVFAPDHAALRRQVEYCLSDEHLRYNKFFHDKISREPGGWLDIALIPRCRNLKGMKVTTDDILAALMGSRLEVKEGGGFVRRSGNAALPKLELKLEKKAKRAQVSASSAPSESLQAGFRPSIELEVPKATVKSGLADRIIHNKLLSPLSTTEREAEPVTSSSSVSQKRAKVSAPDHAALRRQVEYCFSDEHLRQDKFLHDQILSDPDGWLRTSWILSCKEIKGMGAKLEDLLVALEGSSLEIKDGGGFVRRAGNAALPKLVPKTKRQTKAKRAVESESSASSAPVKGGFDPSSEFPFPNATVESAPSDRVFSPLLLAPIAAMEPDAAFVAARRAALGERAKKAKASAPNPALLRKHIENYLSDEYLSFNHFLRDEIKRVGDGWLDVLTLRKLTGLRATADQILAALEGSSKIEVKEGGNFVRRSRNALSRQKMSRHQKKSSVHAQDGGLSRGADTVSKEEGFSKEQQPSPKRIRKRREKGMPNSGKKPKSPNTLGAQLISDVKTLRARVKQIIHSPSDGEASRNDPNNILNKVHEVILEHVAIASFAVKDLRTSFALDEIVNRIVKSVFNSAKRQELRAMHFEEACDQFVELAMTSYEARFGDQGWFFELDLAPTFTLVAWELWKERRGLRFEEVEAKATGAFDRYLDSAMVSKGMWEAASNTFEDEEVQHKVFASVQKAYKPAFDSTIMEVGPDQELERVQEFLKRWMNDSMSRAWSSIPDAESVLTVSSVCELFQNMLAPFGPDHPFSTIPSVFTKRIGLPPWNWDFVDREVELLINSWTLAPSRVRLFKRTLADFLIW